MFGSTLYADLPDPVPVHWRGDGTSDGFGAKGFFSVFSAPLIGLGVTGFLLVVSLFAGRAPLKLVPPLDREEAERRALAGVRANLRFMSVVAFLLAMGTAGLLAYRGYQRETAAVPAPGHR